MPLSTPSVGHPDLATAAQATLSWFRIQAIRAHTNEMRNLGEYFRFAKEFLSTKCDNISEAFDKMQKAESITQEAKPVMRDAFELVALADSVYQRLVSPRPRKGPLGFVPEPAKNHKPLKEEEMIRLLLNGDGYVGLARLSVASLAIENLASIEINHALDQAWAAVGKGLKEVFAQLARHLDIGTECLRCKPHEIPLEIQNTWATKTALQIAQWFAAD